MDYMRIIGMILPSAFSLAGGYYMYKLQRRDRIIEEEKESRKRAIAEEKAAQKQESEAIRNGLCAVLRAYHNLGGNGLVTKVYKEVLELPHILKG